MEVIFGKELLLERSHVAVFVEVNLGKIPRGS